jgi:hypothetical protein
VAHLSDQVARDWRLSPDGRQLAYSAAESGPAPAVVARLLDLETGEITDALAPDTLEAGPPSTGVARGEFNPAWKDDGALTVASLNLDGGASAVTVAQSGIDTETSAADRMDLPLAWSPDETALVVRAVEGETPFEAGPSYVEIVSVDGRQRISDSSDITMVGWLE